MGNNSVTCGANHIKFETLMYYSEVYNSAWKFSISVKGVVPAGRLCTESENFQYFEAAFPPPVAIEVKLCTDKRIQVPVGPAEFDVNRCSVSPLRGEKPDVWQRRNHITPTAMVIW